MQINKNLLVDLTNVGVQRGKRWLVRGVDLKIDLGEILTLIGPNGSGKSTTAKLVLGIINPSEGQVQRNTTTGIGYVPQTVKIDWTLPLNVRRFMRLTNSINLNQIHAALDLAGVMHLENEQIRNLSGGEFQRVLLARAISAKPKLIVLDEPMQGVDFNGEIAIYELIKDIRDELSAGILLISHNLHMVMASTDKVICLNGHVCCSGTPKVVASSKEYKELFGIRAVKELAIYEHSHDHTHLPDGSVEQQKET